MLEVEPADELTEYREWDFPKQLFPTRKQGQKRPPDTSVEPIYDLVGRILFDGTHYTARYLWTPPSSSTPRLYAYDGVQSRGMPIQLPASCMKTHLFGSKIHYDGSNVTVFGIYHLRNGLLGQQKF